MNYPSMRRDILELFEEAQASVIESIRAKNAIAETLRDSERQRRRGDRSVEYAKRAKGRKSNAAVHRFENDRRNAKRTPGKCHDCSAPIVTKTRCDACRNKDNARYRRKAA